MSAAAAAVLGLVISAAELLAVLIIGALMARAGLLTITLRRPPKPKEPTDAPR